HGHPRRRLSLYRDRRRQGRQPQPRVEPRAGNRTMSGTRKFYRIDMNGTPRHVIDEDGRWRLLEGDLFGRHEPGEEIARDGQTLLPPVLPSKLVCIGLNYKDHAAEQNKPLPKSPLMFIKPSTAVIGPGGAIALPEGVGRI